MSIEPGSDVAGAVPDVAGQAAPAAPGNRKLLRLEVRNAETPIERKPPWIKTRARMGPELSLIHI